MMLKNKTARWLFVNFVVISVFIPVFAVAYEPLAGKIPGLTNTDDIGSYINALFSIALMVGVILSVIIIAYSGIEYMTIDVAMKKSSAKTRIRRAITGLLMLLAVYLIFNQINPQILELKIFN